MSRQNLQPLKRGLSRIEAAEYIGIGLTKFDCLVSEGRMPAPRRIDTRKIWDVRELDMAFDALPGGGDAYASDEPNDWD